MRNVKGGLLFGLLFGAVIALILTALYLSHLPF
jgi:hypothetical protein